MPYYQRLRDLREDNDKTLKEIAEILKTSYQYYQKYEKGKKDLPLERAIILADYYNVSLDYLAGRTNNKGGIGCGAGDSVTISQNLNTVANVTINKK